MSSADRFPFSSRPLPGSARRQVGRIGRCVCGYESFIADNSKGGMPPEVVGKRLVRLGWRIGRNTSQDRCPRCSGGKPQLSPQQKRAAFCRIAGVPRAGGSTPKEPTMTDASTQAVRDAEDAAREASRADPPRNPTREDNARILDALHAAYLVEPGRYKGSGSDAQLADELKVPRAWVAAIREQFFGPDANEAAEQRRHAVTLAEAALDAVEKKVLSLVDEVARLRNDVARLKS